MRVDANVSVRRPGEPLGTRCEIKNVNSVRSLGRAIEYEARRQVDLIEGRRQGPPGDTPLGRGRWSDALVARQGRRGRLPLLPRTGPRPARPRCSVDRAASSSTCGRACRPDRRSALVETTGVVGEAIAVVVERHQDAIRARRDRRGRRPGAGARARAAGVRRSRRAAGVAGRELAALTVMEGRGELTATQAKDVLATMLEQVAVIPPRSRRRRATRRWTPAPSKLR